MPQNHVSIPCFPLLVTFENILIYPISLPLFKIIPEELSQSLKSLVSIQLLTHLFSPSGFLNGNSGIVGRKSKRPTKLPKTPNVLCLEWAIKFRDLENICLKNWQLSSSQPDLCLWSPECGVQWGEKYPYTLYLTSEDWFSLKYTYNF